MSRKNARVQRRKYCGTGRKVLRYPTTREIVDFLHENLTTRCSIIAMQNETVQIRHPDPDDFCCWLDECCLWDEAEDLRIALEKGVLVPVSPNDIPELLVKGDYENVIELVEYHHYHHHELYDILPDPNLPEGGKHCLSGYMKRSLDKIHKCERKVRKILDGLKPASYRMLPIIQPNCL